MVTILIDILRIVVLVIFLVGTVSPLIVVLYSLLNERFCIKSLVISFILSIVCGQVTMIPYEEMKITRNLYAISDNFVTQGQGTIHRFYIEEQNKIHYISDYKSGKKIYSTVSSNAYVVESNTKTPQVEITFEQKVPKNKFSSWVHKETVVQQRNHEYKFIVPTGTLTNEFNIDLN